MTSKILASRQDLNYLHKIKSELIQVRYTIFDTFLLPAFTYGKELLNKKTPVVQELRVPSQTHTQLKSTWSWWSLKVCTQLRWAKSQTLTVWSEEEETKCCWSGAKSTLSTQDPWPDRVHARLLLFLECEGSGCYYSFRQIYASDLRLRKTPLIQYTE